MGQSKEGLGEERDTEEGKRGRGGRAGDEREEGGGGGKTRRNDGYGRGRGGLRKVR